MIRTIKESENKAYVAPEITVTYSERQPTKALQLWRICLNYHMKPKAFAKRPWYHKNVTNRIESYEPTTTTVNWERQQKTGFCLEIYMTIFRMCITNYPTITCGVGWVGFLRPQPVSLTSPTRASSLVKASMHFFHVIDWPTTWTILQLLPASENSVKKTAVLGACAGHVSTTVTFSFNACSTHYAHHILPIIRKEQCSNTRRSSHICSQWSRLGTI